VKELQGDDVIEIEVDRPNEMDSTEPLLCELEVTVVTKFCVTPELLMMPTPLMLSVNTGLLEIVKALAPGLNTMPCTWVKAEVETLVTVDNAKVAVSAAELRTIVGSQFAAVFQSPL